MGSSGGERSPAGDFADCGEDWLLVLEESPPRLSASYSLIMLKLAPGVVVVEAVVVLVAVRWGRWGVGEVRTGEALLGPALPLLLPLLLLQGE